MSRTVFRSVGVAFFRAVGVVVSGSGWWVLVSVVAIFGGVMYLLVRADREYERADSQASTQISWTAGWVHAAPEHSLNVVGAHCIMQQHRNCDRADCPRKAVAYQVLVEARHIRPDAGRAY